MKKKIEKILALLCITIMVIQIHAYADTLNLYVNANSNNISIGDNVKVTVSWNEGMQAADFILKYDPLKLEFVKSDLEDDFISCNEGKIRTSWFSIDDKDKNKIEYTFKAIDEGMVEFETETTNGGFATGELIMPTGYNEGKLQIEINEKNTSKKILIYIGIMIAALTIFLLCKNNKKRK